METSKRLTVDELAVKLQELLGEKGLDELTSMEVTEVKALMSSYQSNKADWEKYAYYDPHKYTRNLVSNGNGKFNLLILCWSEGTGSAIHDHANSHCIMKMLDGELIETQYEWPTMEGEPLQLKKETKLEKNEVAYIHDKIGLHRVENPSHIRPAVSLHLYTPPYSECKTFVQESGTARKSGNITFYSVGGKKVGPQ